MKIKSQLTTKGSPIRHFYQVNLPYEGIGVLVYRNEVFYVEDCSNEKVRRYLNPKFWRPSYYNRLSRGMNKQYLDQTMSKAADSAYGNTQISQGLSQIPIAVQPVLTAKGNPFKDTFIMRCLDFKMLVTKNKVKALVDSKTNTCFLDYVLFACERQNSRKAQLLEQAVGQLGLPSLDHVRRRAAYEVEPLPGDLGYYYVTDLDRMTTMWP